MGLNISAPQLIIQSYFRTPCCLIFLVVSCLLSACTLPASPPLEEPEATVPDQGPAPDNLQIEPLPFTFAQPTQFFVDGNTLWVAQLNGGENERQGQIVTVDLTSGDEQIRLESLDKPTGIALIDDTLWIATRNELLKWPTNGPTASPEVVLTDLPNNGRSNGTLTVAPDGRLIFETSGNSRDADSGKLWAFDPQTGERALLATGLKGGYAHVFDGDGRLWITEIADGAVDGVTLFGEVNMLNSMHLNGDSEIPDFGWPRCYSTDVSSRELVGPDCVGVRAPVATLPLHSTPTGIALSPFADDALIVALWVTGEVIEIPYVFEGDNAIGESRVLLSELRNPQHLETQVDGSVLVSEFGTGTIYRIQQ